MAGSMAVVVRESEQTPVLSDGDQWEVSFSRFFAYPSLLSTCSLLNPIPIDRRYLRIKGTWITSGSSTASLRLFDCPSTSDAILSVCFQGKIFEEHYVSELQYAWPQVQCDPGYPVRGSRIVFASYRDSCDQIQKFALRFRTVSEAGAFIKAVEDIYEDQSESEPLNSDFQSEISSQSVYMPSSMPPSSSCVGEAIDVTPVQPYSPQLPLSLNYEVEQEVFNKEMALNNTCEGISSAFPPSFTSLLSNCYSQSKQAEAQPSASQEFDLKSQIVKYMEDSSFQDMLIKVEKVIGEIGVDLM